MKIITSGRNIPVTDAIKTYVEEKFQKIEKHYDFLQEIHVFISVEKNPRIKENQLAEATIAVNRAIIRVEVSSDDLYGSIDALVDKVDRSLRRHKQKLLKRSKSAHSGHDVHGEEISIRKRGLEEAGEEPDALDEEEEFGVFITFEEDEETAPVQG
ncbi:MAG: ribosome-associated translation inhibitor RaiA [Candidatus Melainabacteria bacterium]